MAMTIGQLSHRTGLSRSAIRELEGRGLVHSLGRSEGNYRLFDESALRCVSTLDRLRGLGLTLAEIEQLRDRHRRDPEPPIDAQLQQMLDGVRARLTARVGELQATIARIDAFRGSAGDQAAGDQAAGEHAAGRWRDDPCLAR